MKKAGCMVAMAVFLFLTVVLFANSAGAFDYCEKQEYSCCMEGQKNAVAKTKFSMCWSWSSFQCVPCHGGGKWGYLAEWCNDNYPQCEGKCDACWPVADPDSKDCVMLCYDKHGHKTCK